MSNYFSRREKKRGLLSIFQGIKESVLPTRSKKAYWSNSDSVRTVTRNKNNQKVIFRPMRRHFIEYVFMSFCVWPSLDWYAGFRRASASKFLACHEIFYKWGQQATLLKHLHKVQPSWKGYIPKDCFAGLIACYFSFLCQNCHQLYTCWQLSKK